MNEKKTARLLDLFKKGMPAKLLAPHFCITRRHVYRILKAHGLGPAEELNTTEEEEKQEEDFIDSLPLIADKRPPWGQSPYYTLYRCHLCKRPSWIHQSISGTKPGQRHGFICSWACYDALAAGKRPAPGYPRASELEYEKTLITAPACLPARDKPLPAPQPGEEIGTVEPAPIDPDTFGDVPAPAATTFTPGDSDFSILS
ncbi:MAG: hypothetical protein KGJ13_07535 [Patescibacteria group bacterium]|nr:hypothetical protein [Patescibacteria group bacterium]